jgi:hypothetical protein
MGVMTQKYWVSVTLCPKLPIIAKTVGYTLQILSENMSFSKHVKTHLWDHYV